MRDDNKLLKAQLARSNEERLHLMHSLNKETAARKQGARELQMLTKQLQSPQQKTAEAELELVLMELAGEKQRLQMLQSTAAGVNSESPTGSDPRSPSGSPTPQRRATSSAAQQSPSQPNNEELAEAMASTVSGLALGQYTAAEHRAAVMTEALHELQVWGAPPTAP